MVIIEVTRKSSNVEGSECFHVLYCFSVIIYNKCFAGRFSIISDILRNKRVGVGHLSLFLNSIDRFTWILKHWKARFLLNSFFQHLTWRSGCLTSSWTELQTLLRYCLIHVTITTLRHFLYLVYFLPCLGPGLCYIFVIFCTF